jgi:DNA helicase-2/ATP-dependent DNA helicase PcrA
MESSEVEKLLLTGLDPDQELAVRSGARRLLILAGAGSGKTEVMARRVAWWLGVDGVPKDKVVAFTFTRRAAEEMQFRIRRYIQLITLPGEDPTLGGMYVGTIHSFCLQMLRELDPSTYHNFDVLEDVARVALVNREFHTMLGLPALQRELAGRYPASVNQTIDTFLAGYDLLNEYDLLDVKLAPGAIPRTPGRDANDWCRGAALRTRVGSSDKAKAFAMAAARYYAFLRSRRFLDHSTSQSELTRLLRSRSDALEQLRERVTHVVVDEVQDVNPVQDGLIRALTEESGRLTAVGDHRQAIFAWRGGRVELMANLDTELRADFEGGVVELTRNYRSTPRIVEVSNLWNDTIGTPGGMPSPAMIAARPTRLDRDPSHVGTSFFVDRASEAAWIAETIGRMRAKTDGAYQDTDDGSRGLTLSDFAVLIRSASDARTYMAALQDRGIPAVVRAGPDLFSQPEVLLMVGALAITANMNEFRGSNNNPKGMPARIRAVLDCDPEPELVVRSAAKLLRDQGLAVPAAVANRLIQIAQLVRRRIEGDPISGKDAEIVESPTFRRWLTGRKAPRRVFPQTLYTALLSEAGVRGWDTEDPRGATAMFHLGQLSGLVTGMETPGWTSPESYRYQVMSLLIWGAKNARPDEAPLLVQPDAVNILTIHTAKGLEFGAVFLADVAARRFPSSQARRVDPTPFDGPITKVISPEDLSDNENYDDERRLMYVALTRAERYLFVTAAGPQRSRFFLGASSVSELIADAGGLGDAQPKKLARKLDLEKSTPRRDDRLVTSFSDLRYFLECPHDFYLRKVLGFTPTIDQAFGYGRGVHNLLREVHSNPAEWAALADDLAELKRRVEGLIEDGLFVLRHTTGRPLERLEKRAVEVVTEYVRSYRGELERLTYEPERAFETLLTDEEVLVSGAIDLVRLDDPPRVTIIDFKSGESDSDARMALSEEEMRLQVTMYGLAAVAELEYSPEEGIVRYLGESDPTKRELQVELTLESLDQAYDVIARTARSIRDRKFHDGPLRPGRKPESKFRCSECDYAGICGRRKSAS